MFAVNKKAFKKKAAMLLILTIAAAVPRPAPPPRPVRQREDGRGLLGGRGQARGGGALQLYHRLEIAGRQRGHSLEIGEYEGKTRGMWEIKFLSDHSDIVMVDSGYI